MTPEEMIRSAAPNNFDIGDRLVYSRVMKLKCSISIGLALGTLVYSGISQGEPSRELATESKEAQQQSETKPKSPDQVLDWKALSARLTALPEDQRRATLEALETSGFSTTDRCTYVELMRKLVPKAEQAAALRHLISEVPPTSDYAQVTALLDGIQATPEERKVAMRAAGGRQIKEIASTRKVTQQDLDTMRLWLKAQDPAAMDRLTGEAIGEALAEVPVTLGRAEVGNFNFTHAYFLLVDYPRNKDTDELISGYIKVVTERETDPRTGCVAGAIQDPVLQKEASDRIARSFALHPFKMR